jgi:hypothetical protein
MGMDGEGTISDDDMNWSRSVCWMSLIYEKNWGLFRVSYIFFLLGLFTGFLYYGVSILQGYSCFVCTKGMRGIRKMMT